MKRAPPCVPERSLHGLGPILGVFLLFCAIGLPRALAQEPLLTVERDGGPPGHHPISRIENVTFMADTLRVLEVSQTAYAYPLAAVTRIWFDFSGTPTSAGVDLQQAAAVVRVLRLFQNRPNPTASSTSIAFDLPVSGRASLAIYSVSGARVRTLVDGVLDRGRHTISWDGEDEEGRPVAGGVYFYRLAASGVRESRRMIYLR